MAIAGILAIVAGVFWWDSTRISAAEAQMYPRLILIALFALSALMFVRGWRMDPSRRGVPVISALPAFALFVAATLVYAASVGAVGFFTSSVIYVPLAAWLIGLRRHRLNLIVSLVFLVATWLIFVALFARPLPPEIFWN